MRAQMHLAVPGAVVLLWLGLIAQPNAGSVRVLDARRHLLGPEGEREWREFAGQAPHGRRLDVTFAAESNTDENTVFIRQRDVKLEWRVELNGSRLGVLSLNEADLVQALPVMPGALRSGENTLSIISPEGRDDIVVGEIRLADRPRDEVLTEATLSVEVSDKDSQTALPSRLTITDVNGSSQPLHIFTNQSAGANLQPPVRTSNTAPLLAVRTGVIYSTDGTARFGLPAGNYLVCASRGFEYGVRKDRITVAPGQSLTLPMRLQREVPTPGLVSCDTHVHTFTYSGHGDASVEERLAALAGEGVELPVATDHNTQTDYTEAVRRLNLQSTLTPVIGNEVTTGAGHFNVFPIQPGSRVPDHQIQDWPALMKELRATPGSRVIVLNHPRNVHSNFQPFGARNFNPVTGENRRGPAFSFDAVEVLNSSALQSDLMIGFRDWFAMLNHGYRVTAVASSDSHDVSRYIVGQGRTYVTCADSDPGKLNIEEACRNLLAGRALVSLGLLTHLTVNDRFVVGDLATGLDQSIRVTATVLGPSWVRADHVGLYANGLKIREQRIEPSLSSIEKSRVTWIIPRPVHDAHFVAIASGPPVTDPFWPIAKPYQPNSPDWEPRVMGATNPVWVDGDGDGKFTPARSYAQAVVDHADDDIEKLLASLAGFDEAVVSQAASLLHPVIRNQLRGELSKALDKAPPHIQRGFAAFAATMPSK